ncbi:MAG: MFS transporter [Thiolinea sp.]
MKISRLRKFAYSVGSVAYGVKDSGFSTFLMLYFNQVLGLPALYVGFALLIALAVDAISDPYVGHWSDRLTSKLGRRHPFMYAAILPVTLIYFYLWNPPQGMSTQELFLFLIVMAIGVRLAITFFEVPNSALIAEIEAEYDKRTTLSGLRSMIAWLGGVVMAVLAFTVFLVPAEEGVAGVINEDGYRRFALLAAAVMFVAMLVSALGTHGLIRQLPRPNTASRRYQFHFFASLRLIYANVSFRSLFLSSLFSMMAFGMLTTLQVYFGTYFFGMSSQQLSMLALMMLPAALLAFPLTTYIARRREKRDVARFFMVLLIVSGSLVLLLKLLGILPETGSQGLFVVLLINSFAGTLFMIALQVILSSMTADLVEVTERDTGYRAEGLYFAAFSFTRKVVTGLGMFASALLLSFAENAGLAMSEAGMDKLAVYYMPLITLLYLISIRCLRGYVLTREEHAKNLALIRAAR